MSQSDTNGIIVTPDRDQAVPFVSDENVTYTCTVDGGRQAVWEVRGRQIVGPAQVQTFAENGFFVEGVETSTSIIRVSGEARRSALKDVPPGVTLLCVAVQPRTGTRGRTYSIITYGERECVIILACTALIVCLSIIYLVRQKH